MNPLSRTPVLTLLIPLIAGLLLQYFIGIDKYFVVFLISGAILMALSYFITPAQQFKYKWLFGAGCGLFMIGVGVVITLIRQQESSFILPSKQTVYKGIVIDIPEEKPKTIAYKTYLPDYKRNIVCYFYRDSLKQKLKPGDEFLFKTIIQHFRNFTEDFNYKQYMNNQGYAGIAFVSNGNWQATGHIDNSPKVYAQRWRSRILDFYKSLGLNGDQFSILAALTVGYQAAMSEDLLQAFRTSGTVHILSVSGWHVALIYAMISFFLGFIHRQSKYYKLKPIITIALLWIYAFVCGLPPSVCRAGIMLTMICLAEIFGRRNYALNGMYVAAFLLLLYNPLSFFDVGFQLSFVSVFALIILYPKISSTITIKNTYIRKIWQLFLISVVAQLATFPLCLYYFGTFPTYFFICNLIIVPIASFIMYAFAGIVVTKSLMYLIPQAQDLLDLAVSITKILLDVLILFIRIFEKLPFALIEGVKIDLISLFTIYAIIISASLLFINKKRVYLYSVLILAFSFILYNTSLLLI